MLNISEKAFPLRRPDAFSRKKIFLWCIRMINYRYLTIMFAAAVLICPNDVDANCNGDPAEIIVDEITNDILKFTVKYCGRRVKEEFLLVEGVKNYSISWKYDVKKSGDLRIGETFRKIHVLLINIKGGNILDFKSPIAIVDDGKFNMIDVWLAH